MAEVRVRTWSPTDPGSEQSLQAVISFAKRFKSTVGFLPDAAFRDRGEAGTLILAHKGEQLVGYVLYGRSRSVLKLTHEPESRKLE